LPIHTVLGPIEPGELGLTSMHEHCLLDIRPIAMPSPHPYPESAVVAPGNLGFVHWNFGSLEDNLVLDDPALIGAELAAIRTLGGAGIVDLTVEGMGRDVRAVQDVARRSGVHIMMGAGLYVEACHPSWARDADVASIAESLSRDLAEGLDGTGVLPALIGEIGTSDPPTRQELRAVTAAARVGAITEAAVNVHVDGFGHHALEIVDLMLRQGMAADRIVLSHMDCHTNLDRRRHGELLARGVILEFDNFGLEFYFTDADGRLHRNCTDLSRMELLSQHLDDGFVAQLVLACDVYTKAQLRANGGTGYDHLLLRIVPALKGTFGVDDAEIHEMLVTTPRRLLDRPGQSAPEVHARKRGGPG